MGSGENVFEYAIKIISPISTIRGYDSKWNNMVVVFANWQPVSQNQPNCFVWMAQVGMEGCLQF